MNARRLPPAIGALVAAAALSALAAERSACAAARAGPAVPEAAPAPLGLHPPVDGPIVRGFAAPPGPFSAGHRGVDFGVAAGTLVVAAERGSIVFAGPVAHDGLFVTLAHDGELQTTYSFLSGLLVAAGDDVNRGEPLGLSGEGHPGAGVDALHFGVKVGGRYVDPEPFLLAGREDFGDSLSLLPLDEPSPDPARRPGRAAASRGPRTAERGALAGSGGRGRPGGDAGPCRRAWSRPTGGRGPPGHDGSSF